MKKYIFNVFKIVGLTFVFVLVLSSCDKWIDTEINTDPDSPADVPMALMLPAIQQSIGYNMAGNDMVRATGMLSQQFDGVDAQSLVNAHYLYVTSDFNNLWETMYTEMFMNSKVYIEKAENTVGSESPHIAGVGRVLVATTLGVATDVFGDMPFSKAFKGTDNQLKPAFDTQEEIYDTLTVILDQAIANFGSTSNVIGIEGDVVYDGDVSAWKKAAYSVKARQALQLSGVNGSAAYTAALTAAANGFASNGDDFQIPWNADNKNPIWQFMSEREHIRMGSTLVDLMTLTDDPRIPYYCYEDVDGNYTGSAIGAANEDASEPGDYVAALDAPSIIMSYTELLFIEAEAHFMLGHTVEAQAAFEAAVAASVLKVTGDANTAWLTANIIGTPVTLELIMTQKYIATFGTNQAYADYRRTGLPNIMVLPVDAVLNSMPTRFPYAQDEITYNGANVPTVTISDKLWWDQ